jgi:hypothetical protein
LESSYAVYAGRRGGGGGRWRAPVLAVVSGVLIARAIAASSEVAEHVRRLP